MDPQNLVTFISPFLSLFSCLIYKAKPAGAPTQRFPFAYSLTQTHNILTKTHQRLVKETKFKETLIEAFLFGQWQQWLNVLRSCMFLLSTIVMLIASLLRDCFRYPHVKVIIGLFHEKVLKFLTFYFDWFVKRTEMFFFFFFAVTAVESGTRALQYLGLDGEQSNVGFDVSADFF